MELPICVISWPSPNCSASARAVQLRLAQPSLSLQIRDLEKNSAFAYWIAITTGGAHRGGGGLSPRIRQVLASAETAVRALAKTAASQAAELRWPRRGR